MNRIYVFDQIKEQERINFIFLKINSRNYYFSIAQEVFDIIP